MRFGNSRLHYSSGGEKKNTQKKDRIGEDKAAAPLKMKPATCRLTDVCGLHVCVQCVDVERQAQWSSWHRQSRGGSGGGAECTRCQLLADRG